MNFSDLKLGAIYRNEHACASAVKVGDNRAVNLGASGDTPTPLPIKGQGSNPVEQSWQFEVDAHHVLSLIRDGLDAAARALLEEADRAIAGSA